MKVSAKEIMHCQETLGASLVGIKRVLSKAENWEDVKRLLQESGEIPVMADEELIEPYWIVKSEGEEHSIHSKEEFTKTLNSGAKAIGYVDMYGRKRLYG